MNVFANKFWMAMCFCLRYASSGWQCASVRWLASILLRHAGLLLWTAPVSAGVRRRGFVLLSSTAFDQLAESAEEQR